MFLLLTNINDLLSRAARNHSMSLHSSSATRRRIASRASASFSGTKYDLRFGLCSNAVEICTYFIGIFRLQHLVYLSTRTLALISSQSLLATVFVVALHPNSRRANGLRVSFPTSAGPLCPIDTGSDAWRGLDMTKDITNVSDLRMPCAFRQGNSYVRQSSVLPYLRCYLLTAPPTVCSPRVRVL